MRDEYAAGRGHDNGGLDQIRAVLAEFPPPDLDAGTAAMTATRRRAGGQPLGRPAETAAWLATWQGRFPPRIAHPRIAIFAGAHGVAGRALPDREKEAVSRAVAAMVEGHAPLNRLCRFADTDLRVYEMALDRRTADFTTAAAMDEEECARAVAYGMMAIEQGVDLVAVAAMGDGTDIAAAALVRALMPGEPQIGARSGPAADAAIAAGVARHADGAADAFELLRRLGGPDIAAAVGTLIAARMARVPALIDGPGAIAAAAVIANAAAGGAAHCALADDGAAETRWLERLGLTLAAPAGLALAAAIPLLRSYEALCAEA